MIYNLFFIYQVWKDAAGQIFFSLSACYGGLIALASYNKFQTNVVRDTFIVTIGNCLTSFLAGFVIFSFLGALSLKLNVPVSDVAGSGKCASLMIQTALILGKRLDTVHST